MLFLTFNIRIPQPTQHAFKISIKKVQEKFYVIYDVWNKEVKNCNLSHISCLNAPTLKTNFIFGSKTIFQWTFNYIAQNFSLFLFFLLFIFTKWDCSDVMWQWKFQIWDFILLLETKDFVISDWSLIEWMNCDFCWLKQTSRHEGI